MAATTYVVNVTTVTGEAGKSRQNTTNALGQLTQVVEDPGGPLNYLTTYGYDTLGNLTQASQTSQTRTFVYNSLSRLTSATNPESNTVNFTYDANGNLLTKTDARAITTTTGYDSLNRPISTSYTDGTTQPVTFCYEGKVYDPATGGCANPSPAIPNSIARLTGVGSSVSATNFTDFDLLGRILSSHQATDGFQYNFAYTYNLGGGLETQQYPSGLVAKTCYDAAGRITDVTNDGTSAPYASGIEYAPHGAADKLTLGNGLSEHTNFNNRLQPTQIGLGTTPGTTNKLLLNFTYGGTSNNGNILTQTITPPGLTALVQNYTYDPVNRILTASEAAGANWSRTYDYDPYGNRAVIATSGLPTSPLMPGTLAAFSTATNQITLTGTSYDLAGNQTATALNETLVYDANNHQTSYFDPISAVTTDYEYDGQGNRVKKIAPSKTGIYVYDAFGKLAAEYSTVAPSDPGTHYRTVDHLGSTRLVTDAAGTEIERRDYLPFGEEIPSTVGNRGAGSTSTLDDRHRFTGKERDTESQLDYFLARYYSGPMGRFLSVDPGGAGADYVDPQRWHGYSYTRNNPLAFVDPDGEKLRIAAAQSAKDTATLIGGLARQYSTSIGRTQIERVAGSIFEVEVGIGPLAKSTQGPANTGSGLGTTFGTTSTHLTGGITEVDVRTNQDGTKIANIRGPEGMERSSPIRVTVDPKNARQFGKSVPRVLAHELGGHTTTILDAVERPGAVPGFPGLDLTGTDPKYDEPGARKSEKIGKIPRKPAPGAVEAVKKILGLE